MHRPQHRTIRISIRRRPATLLTAGCIAAALVASACTGAGESDTSAPDATDAGDPTPGATDAGDPAPSPSRSTRLIQQPALGRWQRITRGQLALKRDRVDLVMPSFSHPTEITNPLFPISHLHSAVALGHVDGERLKVETTLLPQTKVIEWNGVRVETLQSQFLAYHDGRIDEVAIDWYAQADDGAVWYFGEDVFIYERGRVVDTLGTWRAGVDGPASMIMPNDPQVGDAYRPRTFPDSSSSRNPG